MTFAVKPKNTSEVCRENVSSILTHSNAGEGLISNLYDAHKIINAALKERDAEAQPTGELE